MVARLPAHAIVAMLRASVEAAGGFVAIIRRGDADAGGIMILTAPDARAGTGAMLWERRTGFDGRAGFVEATPDPAPGTRATDPAIGGAIDPGDAVARLEAVVDRRLAHDPDLWAIHLDVPSAPRFIAALADDG